LKKREERGIFILCWKRGGLNGLRHKKRRHRKYQRQKLPQKPKKKDINTEKTKRIGRNAFLNCNFGSNGVL